MSSTLLRRLRAVERETRRLAMLPDCTPMPLSDFRRPYEYVRMQNGYRLELRGSYSLRTFA
jgi:hypothetical protein